MKRESKFAVFLVDIDNYKFINRVFGFKSGDNLLKNISRRINSLMEERDLICRYGGNKFIIFKPGCEKQKNIEKSAQSICDAFEEPFKINGKKVNITLSIGAAFYPDDSANPEELLKYVETALYSIKVKGKNNHSVFDKSIYEGLLKKELIKINLNEALERNQFILYYQPQIDIMTGEVIGLEALIRWNHPEFGLIMPSEFITIAEESSFASYLGQWVLKSACIQNKKWHDNGYKHIYISVNISERQLFDKNFLNILKEVLSETELEPKYLHMEITERIMIKSFNKIVNILKPLRDMGIKIALDDFGTGYSSLSYLSELPVDVIKIDKSFIDNINNDLCKNIITQGIIDMANGMGMDVIAEGVENYEQLRCLMEKHCNTIQGYLFAKPVLPDEIEKLLINPFENYT